MQIFDKILDRIRQIQSEPEEVKIRYIWSVAIILFVMVIAAWLVSSKLSLPSVGAGKGTPAPVIQNDVKDKIKDGYGELKNNVLPELRSLFKEEAKTNETQIAPSPSQGVNK